MEPPARNGDGPGPQHQSVRLWKRRRPLAIGGLSSFAVGLPMVSVEDGIVLSSIGLLLECIALLCLILVVFALIDEGAEGKHEGHG